MYIKLADPAATLDLTQMTILAQYLQMQQKNTDWMRNPPKSIRRTAFLYTILGELARAGQKTDNSVPIRRAICIMENHYNTNLNIEDIADAVGLARSYFSTLFKSVMGMSPHAYLTKLRIERFFTLIKDENISVANAAEYVGLDPQNFSRIFRRETGQTPLEYKRSLLEK